MNERSCLLALLRGDVRGLDEVDGPAWRRIVAAAEYEGVAPLIAEVLAGHRVSGAGLERFAPVARREALVDVVRERCLRKALAALRTAGVEALVFKGEHLAHFCYARSDLRARLDSDLLIRPRDRARACQALIEAGYLPAAQLEGDLLSYQTSLVTHMPSGTAHVIDLHWRVCNPEFFSSVLTVEELFEHAAPLVPLGDARAPRVAYAMLLAILHPLAHHRGAVRLVWDVDVARLASLMSHEDWTELKNLAVEKDITRVCGDALSRVASTLDAPVPSATIAALVKQAVRESRALESAARATRAGRMVHSLRAQRGWRQRARLLRQYLVPPPAYMRSVYAPASRAPLGVLYLRRAIAGAWKYSRS